MALARDKGGFRITAWPEARLPHPSQRPWRYELRHDSLVPVAPPDAGDAGDDPVGEVYLRLRAVRLDDPDEILAFANEFGILGVRADDFAGISGVPSSGLRRWRTAASAALAHARKSEPAPIPLDDMPDVEGDAWSPELPPIAETVTEFRLGADYLADLTDLWRYATGAVSNLDLRILDKRALWGDRFGAGRNLEEGLAPALKPFHPRVMVSGGLSRRRAVEAAWMRAPLFSVCALELFNHIAEGATYRQCGNERCRRLFVRHVGRARSGQHRTEGIRFCSTRCLRAQTQRAYRARGPRPTGKPDRQRRESENG